MKEPTVYCHGCHQLVPQTHITYQDIIYQYCLECELDMKTNELQTLVQRIDFLKMLQLKEKTTHE